MDKQALSSSLANLEISDSRPKAVQFREIYPQIERALLAGVSHTQVLEEINKHSKLALSKHTFKGYLERTRKQRLANKTTVSTPVATGQKMTAPLEAKNAAAADLPLVETPSSSAPTSLDIKKFRDAPVNMFELESAAKARKVKK